MVISPFSKLCFLSLQYTAIVSAWGATCISNQIVWTWVKGFMIKAVSFGGSLLLSVFPRGYPLIKLMIFSKNFSLPPSFIPRGKDDKMWSLVVSETEGVNSSEWENRWNVASSTWPLVMFSLKSSQTQAWWWKGLGYSCKGNKEISASFRWLTHCFCPKLQDHAWHQYWEMLSWFPGPLLRKVTKVPCSTEKEDDRF